MGLVICIVLILVVTGFLALNYFPNQGVLALLNLVGSFGALGFLIVFVSSCCMDQDWANKERHLYTMWNDSLICHNSSAFNRVYDFNQTMKTIKEQNQSFFTMYLRGTGYTDTVEYNCKEF